jgi:hypothetical protein
LLAQTAAVFDASERNKPTKFLIESPIGPDNSLKKSISAISPKQTNIKFKSFGKGQAAGEQVSVTCDKDTYQLYCYKLNTERRSKQKPYIQCNSNRRA